jgi:hypothetical protein
MVATKKDPAWEPLAFRGEEVIGPRSVHCLVVIFDRGGGLTTREVASALGFGDTRFKNKYGSICHALNKLYSRDLLSVELVTRGVRRFKHKSGKTVTQTRKVCMWKLTTQGKREAKQLSAPVHALLKSKLGLGVIRGIQLS